MPGDGTVEAQRVAEKVVTHTNGDKRTASCRAAAQLAAIVLFRPLLLNAVAVLIVGAIGLSVAALAFTVREVPVQLPGNVTVEIPFVAPTHRRYVIELGFVFKTAEERVIAKQIAGDPYTWCDRRNTCGVPVEFEIEIFRSGARLLERRVLPKGTIAFSADRFSRRVMDFVLTPGKYRAKVRARSTAEELRSVPLRLTVTTDLREADIED